MAYIGRDIQYGTLDKQSFTANGSTKIFTLNSGVKDAKSLLVVLNGVIQEPEVAYTASGTTLTFVTAPTNGHVLYVIYLGKELSVGASRENITYQTGTGNNSTTPLTLSTTPYNASAIMVMLNGVTQRPVTDYTVSGTTLTFTSAVATGVNILVYHLGSQSAIGTINNNAVTDAKIVSMNASKLTGSLPSSMAVDTTKIDQTISALGLHIGVADNKISYNLPAAFIDTFEDDSGILTETTVDRVTDEYVSSIYTASTVLTPSSSSDWAGNTGSYSYGSGSISTSTGDNRIYTDMSSDLTGDFTVQFTATDETTHSWGVVADSEKASTGDQSNWYSTTNSFAWRDQSSTGHSFHCGSTQESGTHEFVAGSVVKITRESGTIKMWDDGVLVHTFTTTTYTGAMQFVVGNDGGGIGNLTSITLSMPSTTTNATGTLISKASTADAAVSSTSGVMLYENAEGTGTLGTDLKIYFSSDDGANWTEASSYGTPTTFIGTTKMVKLGKTTIANTGTAVKMKAEWANQVATVAGGYQSGDRSSSITVTTTISEASGTVANLVDGSAPTDGSHSGSNSFYWANGSNNVVGQELKFQWSSAQTITGAKMLSVNTNSQGTWKWQGSNNGSAWTDIGSNFNFDTATTKVWDTTFGSELSGNTTAYTYYRMYGVSGSTNGNPWWMEIEFYHTAVAGKVQRLHGWAVNY